MKSIKVLGSGCKNCTRTAEMITAKADELGIEIQIEKVSEMADIMAYGVMSTPGVVIDETVVHAGGLPSPAQIRDWLLAPAA